MDYKEKVIAILNDEDIPQEKKDKLLEIFPELAESEDEKIKKAIYNALKYLERQLSWDFLGDVDILDAYDWLEKQGEKKSVISDGALREGITHFGITQYQIDNWLKKYVDVEKQGEQKPTDKVQPKFKGGDWVIGKQCIVHQIANVIENVTTHTFGYDIVGGGYFNDNTEGVRLWTIQDAKDGDVLFQDLMGGKTFIYNGVNPNTAILYSFIISNDGEDVLPYHIGKPNTGIGNIEENKNIIHPATKEQRDLLFQKMREKGYEWDNVNKNLKKIVEKSAWTEEDSKNLRNLICKIWASDKFDVNEAKYFEEWLIYLEERIKGE